MELREKANALVQRAQRSGEDRSVLLASLGALAAQILEALPPHQDAALRCAVLDMRETLRAVVSHHRFCQETEELTERIVQALLGRLDEEKECAYEVERLETELDEERSRGKKLALENAELDKKLRELADAQGRLEQQLHSAQQLCSILGGAKILD